mmetsp:Transcript_12529/g.20444  ORF Transcript_12529/g.20444 Transcript_12529/m.20444 type:complete len:304 (-) Transcript_12529:375-1286(-)|eukprot:CAMPEP_0184643262 /NCGR_PEP_ID=MMETSP0308-20130426/73_1 /TAXON_ID=38269 /ORGANISM="Gloeochaete witrockiana, Strain SAG 46.84" /LENGTH=303 /DNA_ID=CAMNT_0027071059 /DNA_START=122 /DNA_END=1033 /DNA_ORIENTATION=-
MTQYRAEDVEGDSSQTNGSKALQNTPVQTIWLEAFSHVFILCTSGCCDIRPKAKVGNFYEILDSCKQNNGVCELLGAKLGEANNSSTSSVATPVPFDAVLYVDCVDENLCPHARRIRALEKEVEALKKEIEALKKKSIKKTLQIIINDMFSKVIQRNLLPAIRRSFEGSQLQQLGATLDNLRSWETLQLWQREDPDNVTRYSAVTDSLIHAGSAVVPKLGVAEMETLLKMRTDRNGFSHLLTELLIPRRRTEQTEEDLAFLIKEGRDNVDGIFEYYESAFPLTKDESNALSKLHCLFMLVKSA